SPPSAVTPARWMPPAGDARRPDPGAATVCVADPILRRSAADRGAREMDFSTPDDKARRFKELHAGPGIFVTPNPWDAGSAKALAQLGFPALATSSANAAMVLGRKDYQITR